MATTLFNNLITFSRGTNATLVGANGLVQYAPNNLLTYSEQFDNAAWTKTNTAPGVAPVVTANYGVAPDGTVTADRVQFDGGSVGGGGNSQIAQIPSGISNTPAIYSVWMRSLGASVDITLFYASSTQNVTVTSAWQRFSFAGTSPTGEVRIAKRDAWSTAGTADLLIWGAQLELGTTATTYNSTTVKNLLGYSEAFDNAAWTKTNSSIVAGAAANPLNGLFTAQKLMEDTANAQHRMYGSSTTVAGGTYTLSFYAKSAGRSFFSLYPQSGAAASALFNLDTGTSANGSVTTNLISHSIQSVGSGWYRCAITFSTTGTTVLSHIYLRDSAGAATAPSYTGDGNSGVYIYGAQLSDSGSLDPYVPTPGAAPTSAAYYGPRFDYDPVTLQPKGLLIEEQRTNLLTYSEQFDNAAWVKSNATVTANATSSPDGTVDADRLIPGSTFTDGRVIELFTGSIGVTYTLTVYGKADAFSNIRLFSDDGATNTASVSYNLSTGAVSTAAAVTGTWTSVSTTSTAVGNGWYRLSLTWTATGAAPTRVAIWCRDTGNGTSGIYIWGAQLEAGAFATSYIPTVASTVTRSADVATITGSLFSGWYNGAQGTFVVGASTFSSAALSRTVASLGGPVNTFAAYVHSGASGAMYDGTNLVLTANQITTNTAFELSTAYSSSGIAACLNNGAVATNATYSGAFGNSSSLGIGNFVAGGLLNGHIRYIAYLPVRNADYQIQGFTA